MFLSSVCHCIHACFFVFTALYKARGLEADGGGLQVQLSIQPTSHPHGANQRSYRYSAAV